MLRRRFLAFLASVVPWLFANKKILTGKKAKAEAAETAIATSETEIDVVKKAPAKAVPVSDAVSETEIDTEKKARVIASEINEATSNTNIFAVIKAGLVAYSRAPVLYLSKILTGAEALLSKAFGVIAKAAKVLPINRISEAVTARAENVVCKDSAFTDRPEAAAITAKAKDSEADKIVPTEIEATAGTASGKEILSESKTATAKAATIVTWLAPEVVDGVLFIRQAFSAEVNDGILEVR